MIRRQEAARAAALFLSFAAFFMTCPLTLWDAALFAQISIDRAVEVLAINGLMATSAVLAVGTGLWSMARDSVRMMPAATVLGGVAYALGGPAYALVQTLALPVGPAGICVISVAMGFGLAMLVLGWCRVLCPFGLKRSLLGMSIACAMATFVELGFEAGLLPAREGAFAVLLWLGVAGPVWSACKGVGEIPAVDDTVGDHLWESMRTMVLNPCLGLFLFLFIMSAREFVFMEYEHIGAISVIGAAGIAVALVRFWPRFFTRHRLPDASAQCGRIFHRAEQLSRWQCLVWCGVPRVSYSYGCYRPACPGVVVRGGAGWGILLSVRGFHTVRGDKPRSVARHQRGAGCSR